MSKPFYIACDFDGTIVDHRFPDIGDPAPGAFRWIREWQAAGASVILWTMRSDGRTGTGRETGPLLSEAVAFCRRHGVEFQGVNCNPSQGAWTNSPKAYAHVYLDDSAFGCPLRENGRAGSRPEVDWEKAGPGVLALIRAHFAEKD